jgi:hypothetical protein
MEHVISSRCQRGHYTREIDDTLSRRPFFRDAVPAI